VTSGKSGSTWKTRTIFTVSPPLIPTHHPLHGLHVGHLRTFLCGLRPLRPYPTAVHHSPGPYHLSETSVSSKSQKQCLLRTRLLAWIFSVADTFAFYGCPVRGFIKQCVVPVLFHAANIVRTRKTSVLPHYLGARVTHSAPFLSQLTRFRSFVCISSLKCPFFCAFITVLKLLFFSLVRNT
jgi:hypothetical protein